MFKIVFFKDSENIALLERRLRAADEKYLLEKVDADVYFDELLTFDVNKYDLVFVSDNVYALKNVLKNTFSLKYEINEALKRNVKQIMPKKPLNPFGKRSINFDECLLPQGFEPLTDNEFGKSFCGKINDNDKFIFVVDDKRKDVENCLNKFIDVGLIKERRKLCFKMFDVEDFSSDVSSYMSELDCDGLEWKVFYQLGDLTLYVYFDECVGDSTVKNVERAVYLEFGEKIYADFDATLQEVLVYFATISEIKVATAESLTGGLVAERIISVPNASKVVDFSAVTYADRAKHDFLGVSKELLKIEGAVSKSVAGQMAEGLVKKYNCDLGISTTGIAGPTGQTATKPLGLVYVGVATAANTSVERYVFKGDRTRVRQMTANAAIFNAIKFINKL